MKHLLTLLTVLICLSETTFAQAPQSIPYQAVARDNSGNLISNQSVSLRFTIHDATAVGSIVYQETQSKTTNSLGLFTANIGQGSVVTGTFAGINWGGGYKFMQVELDVTGGAIYVDMGTQQMLSVPYALHSGASENTWNTFGNSGTNSSNFIGTIDNVPFNFKVNNQISGVIDPTSKGNTSLGYLSLGSNTSGYSNVAIGTKALQFNTVTSNTVAIGDSALMFNGTFIDPPNDATGNTAIGSKVLYANTAGSTNTGVGFQTLTSNTIGADNTGVGWKCLLSNVSGQNNIGMGSATLFSNISGNDNTGLGKRALKNNSIGNNNVGVGSYSMDNSIDGNGNVAVGAGSLLDNLHGGGNVALGYYAGHNSLGSNNVYIGVSAGQFETGSNKLFIDNDGGSPALIFGDFSTNQVGIGINVPTANLSVNGTADKPGGGTWGAFSDIRLKKDVIQYKDGLEMLLKISPVRYHYNEQSGYDTKPEYVGVIAQELKEIAPYMISAIQKEGKEFYSVDNSSMIYMLVNAVKEQQKMIEELKKRIEVFENK